MDVDDALLRVAEPGFLDVVGQAGLRVVATQGLEVVVDALEADRTILDQHTLSPVVAVARLSDRAGVDEETTIDAAGQASEDAAAAAAHITPDGLPIIPEGVAAGAAGAHVPSSRLPLRILCVDDAKTTRTLLRKLLKKRTQAEAIDVAENGQVAVDMVASKGVGYYSLILMDKEMPVMDGYEAARSIRAMGYRRTMLGVTGNALLADVAEFKRHGVCRVLTKPVDAAVLAKWAEFSTHYEHADVHTAD